MEQNKNKKIKIGDAILDPSRLEFLFVDKNGLCNIGLRGQPPLCLELTFDTLTELYNLFSTAAPKRPDLAEIREFAYGMSIANLNPEDVKEYMEIASACARRESKQSQNINKQILASIEWRKKDAASTWEVSKTSSDDPSISTSAKTLYQ